MAIAFEALPISLTAMWKATGNRRCAQVKFLTDDKEEYLNKGSCLSSIDVLVWKMGGFPPKIILDMA